MSYLWSFLITLGIITIAILIMVAMVLLSVYPLVGGLILLAMFFIGLWALVHQTIEISK